MEGAEAYNVTLRVGHGLLGIRLAARAGGFGAVFDGWRDDERLPSGTNLEMLEVGDRVEAVMGRPLPPDATFDDVSQQILAACETVRKAAKEAEELLKSKEAIRGSMVSKRATKYDLTASRKASVQLELTLAKPDAAREIHVEAEDVQDTGLRVWFRPGSSLMCGARYSGCAPDASEAVFGKFDGLSLGSVLVALNGRAVEAVQFDLVLDAVRCGALPLAMRFARDPLVAMHEEEEEEEKKEMAARRGAARLARAQAGAPESDFETSSEEGDEAKHGPSGGNTDTDPGPAYRAACAADGYYCTVGKTFAHRYLHNFLESIRDENEAEFRSRLECGQDLSVRDDLGRTPLMIAATLPNRAAWFVEALLSEGAVASDAEHIDGNTALHLAASAGQLDVIKLLLDGGADVNAENHSGRTPLFEAVRSDRDKAVGVLIQSRAKVGLVERASGWTCLHYAALSGREDILKALMAVGNADLHAESLAGPGRLPRTALDVAREAGNAGAAQILHEALMQEPLHRVWPCGGAWVVEDESLHVVDLPWRVGKDFDPLLPREAYARKVNLNLLQRHRASAPQGRHSKREVAAREDSLFVERLPLEDGEIWLGSRESLTHRWAVERKRIQHIVVLAEGGESEEQVLVANRWLEHVDHLLVCPAPPAFADFARTALSRVVRYVHGVLERGERVLLVSTAASVAEALHYPAAAALATLVLKRGQDWREAHRMLRQRCYFYSQRGALRKHERLTDVPPGTMTDQELVEKQRLHDVRAAGGRLALPSGWASGLAALDRQVHERKLAQTRRKQARFRATFIM